MTYESGGKQLVIAFFENPAAAEAAARMMERQALARAHGGTVGVLALDHQGRILTAWLGSQVADDGPGVGAVLGAIAVALTAPAPRRDPSGHVAGLTADDIARFAAELEAGQAVVGVLDRGTAAERAIIDLTGFGGKAEVHSLTDQALHQAAAVAAAAPR